MSKSHGQDPIPTILQLAAELALLRERVEDLEDSRDLDAAIHRNDDKQLIPWDRLSSELGIGQS